MNHIPVLKSKLIMPEMPKNFLLTNRLKNLHRTMDSARGVSICAPAGYGKTTLAVSYLMHETDPSSRICWYRLDPEDRNLPVFIAHLTEAIFPPEVGRFAESRKSIQEYTLVELDPRQGMAMICQEMWSHYNRSAVRTYIVFDDFQNVVSTPEICDIAAFLLDNLPPSCTIFVLNRTVFKVFTEKQKLREKVLEIGTEGLAFSQAEINEFLFHLDQTHLDKKASEFIYQKTEGWIAGIIILGQAFKRKGLDITAMESSVLAQEEGLFRYLSLEVLKSVDQDTQDTLARLALLQDFSKSEASEILGIAGIEPLMTQIMGFGLFIQHIYGDPVVYRFHSLFREFLLTILKSRYSGEQLSSLHLKAAAYYLRQEAFVRAANRPNAGMLLWLQIW